jgi:IPT/TIG domain-containing protein
MKILESTLARLALLCLTLGLLATLGCGAGKMHPSTSMIGGTTATPNLSMLTPGSVPVGSPGFTVTVNGSNLGPDAVAFFNGNAEHTVFISSNQIMFTLTATDLQNVGMIPVFVRTEGMTSNTLTLDIMTMMN